MPTKSNGDDTQFMDGNRSGSEPGRPVASAKTEVGETWIALCAQAAVEQDPRKLLELVSEINRLLDVRKKRLAREAAKRSVEQ